jgi:hypothetical protein
MLTIGQGAVYVEAPTAPVPLESRGRPSSSPPPSAALISSRMLIEPQERWNTVNNVTRFLGLRC